jgi:diguanylate cyclase (GGDEF)-like protein
VSGLRDDDETKQTSRQALVKGAGEEAHPSLIILAGPQVGEMYRLSKAEMVLGRDSNADIQILDDSVSRRHARIVVAPSGVQVVDLGSRNGTTVNGNPAVQVTLREGDKIQIGASTVLRFTYQDSLDENFQRQMLDSALRDGLTGAFNKRYFVERLENELRFALRHKSPLSLLLLDLDHFKQVNDTYGHLAGDAVLANFAAMVQEAIRVEDVLTRYGGEEFAVIGRGVDPRNARVLAERIRSRCELSRHSLEGHVVSLSVSIGIAGLPDLAIDDADTLIRSADNALYAAKARGRNRVEVASRAATSISLANEASRPRRETMPHGGPIDEALLANLMNDTAAVETAKEGPRMTVPPPVDKKRR